MVIKGGWGLPFSFLEKTRRPIGMAVHLNWSLPTKSSLAFLHRTFQEAPAPPRLLSVRSQKLSSGSGDPFLSNASGFGPRKSANLDRPEALIGSSGSSSSSSSSSSAIDFLELCLRFMVWIFPSVSLSWKPRKRKRGDSR